MLRAMRAHDSLQRFVFEHAAIRGEIVHLDATWRAVLERHDYPPVVRDLLGELMAAAGLLAATLKFNGSLIMQVQGDGPLSLLVVECTSDRTMRAMAQWNGDIVPAPVAELVGDGRFVITIDPKEGKQRYQGIVSLEGANIAEALQSYLARSEQLDSRLWLAADTRQAAGMLLQKMPTAAAETDGDAWMRAVHLGSTITRAELLQLPALEVIHRLYHEEDIRVFDSKPVRFQCSCSRERVANVLRMLGPEEVRSILDERGSIEAHCEFCRQRYEFDRVDAEQLFAASVMAAARPTRH